MKIRRVLIFFIFLLSSPEARAGWLAPETVSAVKSLLLGIILAAGLTLALVFVVKLINRLWNFGAPGLEAWFRSKVPTLRIQKIELLPAERIADAFSATLGIFYWVLMALIFYFYLPLLLSFFPWTRGLSERLFGYVLSPVSTVVKAALGYIPNLFFIAVIYFLTHYALRFVRMIFLEIRRERLIFSGFYPEWAEPTFQILRFLAWAFALVVIFPYLPGSDSPAFKGVSVFLGVLLSFGSGSSVANAVSGTILTYMRPFKLGDRVQIADTMGDVVERTILVTRIRTIKNVDITIPNSLVLGSHIVNYSSVAKEQGLILNTSVTIGYDAPWKKVHELLIGAAKATDGIMQEPAPFVLQTGLGDFNVTYEINAYTKEASRMAQIYSDLHQNIQDKFNEAGVEIMSPAYTAVRDGNAAAIPSHSRPPNYQAPRFRLNISKESAA